MADGAVFMSSPDERGHFGSFGGRFVPEALIAACRRGVRVRVILDGSSLQQARFGTVAQRLLASGVLVRPSTPAFSITN